MPTMSQSLAKRGATSGARAQCSHPVNDPGASICLRCVTRDSFIVVYSELTIVKLRRARNIRLGIKIERTGR